MLCQIVYIISAFPSLNPDPCDDCDEEKEWGVQSTFILVSSIFCLKAEILQGSLIFFPYIKDIKNLIKSFVLLSHGLDVGLNLLTLRVILMWKKCKIWSCTQAEPLPRVSFSCDKCDKARRPPRCTLSHGPSLVTECELPLQGAIVSRCTAQRRNFQHVVRARVLPGSHASDTELVKCHLPVTRAGTWHARRLGAQPGLQKCKKEGSLGICIQCF